MIFRVNLPNLSAHVGRQNVYVSFCQKKLQYSSNRFHHLLYKTLTQAKLLNVDPDLFIHEIRNPNPPIRIKCIVVNNGKRKLFCNLEQLMPYSSALEVKSVSPFDDLFINKKDDYMREVVRRARDLIAAEANNEIRYTVPSVYAPIRRGVDYQSVARQALIIDELPQSARPVYDYEPHFVEEVELPIQQEPLVVEDNNYFAPVTTNPVADLYLEYLNQAAPNREPQNNE